MSNFTVNIEDRNQRVAGLEKSIREGEIVTFGERELSFKDGRFHIDGKRASVSDAREMMAESVENEMYEEFEENRRFAEASAAIVAVNDAQVSLVEKYGEEMKVADAATILEVSPVRVRRMCEERKLSYGKRGFIKTLTVANEIQRRIEADKAREIARAAKATAKKVQKTGDASDD